MQLPQPHLMTQMPNILAYFGWVIVLAGNCDVCDADGGLA